MSGLITCPNCGYYQPPGAECEHCGVVFNKFRERVERAAAARRPYRPLGESTAPSPTVTTGSLPTLSELDESGRHWDGVWQPPTPRNRTRAGVWAIRIVALMAVGAVLVVFSVVNSVRRSEPFGIAETTIIESWLVRKDLDARYPWDVDTKFFFSWSILDDGDRGEAEFNIPVEGPRGSGEAMMKLSRRSVGWTLDQARYINPDGREFDLLSTAAAEDLLGRGDAAGGAPSVVRSPASGATDPVEDGEAAVEAPPLRTAPPPDRPSISRAELPDWETGIEAYRDAIRRRSKTPLVLYFQLDGCEACRSFEEDQLETGSMADCLNQASRVSIDLTGDPESIGLAEAIGTSAAQSPRLFVVPAGEGAPVEVGPRSPDTPQQLAARCRVALGI